MDSAELLTPEKRKQSEPYKYVRLLPRGNCHA